MIHSSNKIGFTLLETLIALAIMAMILGAVYTVQNNIGRNVGMMTRHLQHLMQAKLFLLESTIHYAKKREGNQEKALTLPKVQMHFEISEFVWEGKKNFFKDLFKERVSVTWQELGVEQKDSIGLLLFKPNLERK